MKYDVFISYSRKDKKLVDKFCEELSKEGIRYWLDNSKIKTGENFKTIIVDAIEASQIFIFFSSVHSNSSEWTEKEIGIAITRGKYIIPIKLDSSLYNKAVEFDLVNIDFVDFTNKCFKKNDTEKIIRIIRNKCKVDEKCDESVNLQNEQDLKEYSSSNKSVLFEKWWLWVICVLVLVIGIYKYINYPDPVIPPKRNMFGNALALLNSNIEDSVKVGFDKMKTLAKEGDDRAKLEVGMTYFALTTESKELRSDSILQRRKHLALEDGNSQELEKAIDYLSTIKDSCALYPEAYYILGIVYYYKHEDMIAALNAFRKGLDLLNGAFDVSHGYDTDDLRKRLESNIRKLEEQL